MTMDKAGAVAAAKAAKAAGNLAQAMWWLLVARKMK